MSKPLLMSDLLDLSYSEYVTHLLNKYGPVPYDYFCTEKCRSVNSKKNSRIYEGLEIHHIAENIIPCLSDSNIASQYPFDYQKADQLVYCDKVEHLFLHYKIAREKEFTFKECLQYFDAGPRIIIGNINTYFTYANVKGKIPSDYTGAMLLKTYPKFDAYIYLLILIAGELLHLAPDELEDDIMSIISQLIFTTFIHETPTLIVNSTKKQLKIENKIERIGYAMDSKKVALLDEYAEAVTISDRKELLQNLSAWSKEDLCEVATSQDLFQKVFNITDSTCKKCPHNEECDTYFYSIHL